MWTSAAVKRIVKKRLLRGAEPSLESVAHKTWVLAAGEAATSTRAVFLPGQIERITGWAFVKDHPGPEMEGGVPLYHQPTRAFLLKDAWLLDGTLSCGDACSYLQRRSKRWPQVQVNREIDHAAVYCTPGGNLWFGQWLMDDCVTYPLAAAEGVPVTTVSTVGAHMRTYEEWLAMTPTRVDNAHLREVVVYDDVGQTHDKSRRFTAMKEKLLARLDAKPHPGVFILRGTAGMRRVLKDELALAERLRDRRGFRIIDPMVADLPTILQTCAGARIVCGVEGSALMHGILVQPPGSAVMTLQPPNRFYAGYKHQADRDGNFFGFVVGRQDGDDFVVDGDEVERTLDLFPASATG